jgi:hypothetical protein
MHVTTFHLFVGPGLANINAVAFANFASHDASLDTSGIAALISLELR